MYLKEREERGERRLVEGDKSKDASVYQNVFLALATQKRHDTQLEYTNHGGSYLT